MTITPARLTLSHAKAALTALFSLTLAFDAQPDPARAQLSVAPRGLNGPVAAPEARF